MNTQPKQICIEKVGFSPPKPTATSTVYQAKNFLEVVTFRALQENLSRYRRIDKTTYLDCSTGELKTYRRKERSSTDQATKCKRSYVVLRRILLANFTASKSELHIVLTVKPQRGADLPSLNQYFRKFWKRFHYYYPTCEYIAIAEPHQTGRFHFHLLLLDISGRQLIVPNEKVQNLWQIGFTQTERIRNVDKLVSYLCSANKRSLWVAFYQPGQRLFRCSKNIARPVAKKMSRKEVDAYAEREGFECVTGYSYAVCQEGGEGPGRTLNVITHEQFRRR